MEFKIGLGLALLALVSANSWAGPLVTNCHQYYPHWCSKPGQAMPQQLQAIESFLSSHKPADGPMAFDWDGTLYNEKIPVTVNGQHMKLAGQPAWFIWGAQQVANHEQGLFPAFKQVTAEGAVDYKAWAHAITDQTLYLEGQFKSLTDSAAHGLQATALPQGVYDKFAQTAVFEAGMTFKGMQNSIGAFLKTAPTSKYEFEKMMDIVHRVGALGYSVWIITGSNPYYVANLIDSIDANNDLGYTIFPGCYNYMQGVKDGSSELSPEAFFTHCKIAGNASTWPGKNQPFSNEYDARNVAVGTDLKSDCQQYAKSKQCKLAVDRFGKLLAAQHIASLEHGKPIILYAGNSDGDYSLMNHVLASQKHFGIFVRPDYGNKSGALYQLFDGPRCSTKRCQRIGSV